MQNLDFEVAPNQVKIGQRVAYIGKRSSVRGDFLNVKTAMGLERFEDEKSRLWWKIVLLLQAQKNVLSKIASVRLRA